MADKRCDNGHFIDEAWDICPYCPQDESEPEIPVVRPRAMEQSAPASAALSAPAPAPMPRAIPSAIPSAPVSVPISIAPPRHATNPGNGSAIAIVSTPFVERTVAAQRIEAGQQQKRYVVGWLVGLNGPSRGEAFALRMGRNVIGRDRRSDIVINDDQASSHHADLVFRPEERRFILMDHNSTNGTYVNEAEIEPRRDLIEKDIVRIGGHRFLFSPLCHDGFHWDDEGLLK
ncbi:MAG TPA: FHA domain-containing protein [Thermoanaerobaculia bacterium]|nr:FHA domain-containing protein [Thermoanaerobaculia bacterium]